MNLYHYPVDGGTALCTFEWNGFKWQWDFINEMWRPTFAIVSQLEPPPFRLERIEKEEQVN